MGIDQPDVALVDHGQSVILIEDIRRPGTPIGIFGIGLEALDTLRGKKFHLVGTVSVHDDEAIAARLALLRVNRLEISDLISSLPPSLGLQGGGQRVSEHTDHRNEINHPAARERNSSEIENGGLFRVRGARRGACRTV